MQSRFHLAMGNWKFWLGATGVTIGGGAVSQPWLVPSRSEALGMIVWSVTASTTGIVVGAVLFRLCTRSSDNVVDSLERLVIAIGASFLGLFVGFPVQRFIVGGAWSAIGCDPIHDPRDAILYMGAACLGTAIVSAIFGSGFWRNTPRSTDAGSTGTDAQ